MELFEVIRTTFAAREFVDEPVPDEVLRKILDNARFAPSGGNRQGWKVLVVREASTRQALVPMIRPTFQRYRAQVQAGESPWIHCLGQSFQHVHHSGTMPAGDETVE